MGQAGWLPTQNKLDTTGREAALADASPVDERAARERLAAAEARIGELESQLGTTESELRSRLAQLSKAHEQVTSLLEVTRGELLQRRQAEAALAERTDRYELIAEGAIGGVWDWDVPSSRVYYSPGWKKLRGLHNDEVSDSQEEWSSRVHPADRTRVMTGVQAHFDGKTPIFGEEYRIRCKDGSYKWILDRGIARRDADGTVTRMAGSELDITERKQAEETRRQLAQRLCSVRDEERSRISRKIHDELGQSLTALRMELSILGGEPSATAVGERTLSMIELIDAGIETVRRIATDLHPSVLDDLGLRTALEWQITEFARRSGVRCTTALDDVSLDQDRATTAFRIVQEALVNVYRHARATRVWVEMTCMDGTVRLSVRDDGCGIESESGGSTSSSGLGLLSMRERALTFDGEVVIQSALGEGTTVVLTLPLLAPEGH